ncbi:hypothetical protein GCM10018952_65030 [Streptosporangium vulgare]
MTASSTAQHQVFQPLTGQAGVLTEDPYQVADQPEIGTDRATQLELRTHDRVRTATGAGGNVTLTTPDFTCPLTGEGGLRSTLMDSARGATPHQPAADPAAGGATVHMKTSTALSSRSTASPGSR